MNALNTHFMMPWVLLFTPRTEMMYSGLKCVMIKNPKIHSWERFPGSSEFRNIRRCAERGTLLCDCCYFDRVGIPCRHIIALLHHILGDEFKGITVDDVRVFWRTDYFFHGMQPQNEMRSLLMKLRDNDTQGPILPSNKVPATISMDDDLPIVKTYHLPLTERCMNFTQIHCQEALERYGNTSCPCNPGLSQEVYAPK
jgi:hypothetical protein